MASRTYGGVPVSEINKELRRLGYSGINDPTARQSYPDKRSELEAARKRREQNSKQSKQKRNRGK